MDLYITENSERYVDKMDRVLAVQILIKIRCVGDKASEYLKELNHEEKKIEEEKFSNLGSKLSFGKKESERNFEKLIKVDGASRATVEHHKAEKSNEGMKDESQNNTPKVRVKKEKSGSKMNRISGYLSNGIGKPFIVLNVIGNFRHTISLDNIKGGKKME